MSNINELIDQARVDATNLENAIHEMLEKRKKIRQFIVDTDLDEHLNGLKPLKDVERAYILKVYEMCGRNKHKTSRVLEITDKTLYNKLERYGVHHVNKSN